MSRRHRCPGEGCGVCAEAIAAAEDERDFGADYEGPEQ